jgi:hypothetical protein
LPIVDVGAAALLVAVSGYVLEGVNNTGPVMPAAVLFIGFVLFAVVAPVAAWVLRAHAYGPGVTLSLALAPIAVGGLAFLLQPLFA